MTLHDDLLAQARHLAQREPRRPRQASLRRAISTTYYGLFHLLVSEAASLLVRGPDRGSLRSCIARAFSHAEKKTVAKQFAKGNVSPKIELGLRGQQPQPELLSVAELFVDLQQARHEADYDVARRFTRREALDLVEGAERAFLDWRHVRGTCQTDTFLVGLLVQKQMKI